ncbi:MAG: hypothetical protein KJ623_01555 [Nanoarchaeota archaeon]|nr:hypothetical protein [Nanoarchaeota archaeon]MBU0962750.1 hypothetical protein [Nanoarchaeota archaeon]
MSNKTIARDIPLAEITLRRYENPSKLKKRELIRKLCLSTGLLQPGDSRDVIVDVLHLMINSKNPISSEQIQSGVIGLRKKQKLPLKGIAHSNIRRQLKRLKDLFLIEKIKEGYRINENEKLINLFEEKIEKYYLQNILSRVKEYYKLVK